MLIINQSILLLNMSQIQRLHIFWSIFLNILFSVNLNYNQLFFWGIKKNQTLFFKYMICGILLIRLEAILSPVTDCFRSVSRS